MAKVTSKLQITIPVALAEEQGIRPGDEVEWAVAGEGLRITPSAAQTGPISVEERLALFDAATKRQMTRQRGRKPASARTRGWKREDLYTRGRTR